MPSKADEESDCSSQQSNDFFNTVHQSDVEELVAAIKKNLRLKSRSCHSLCSKQKRMSPYDIPNSVRTSSSASGSSSKCKHHNKEIKDGGNNGEECQSAAVGAGACYICAKNNNKKPISIVSDDPYVMLQELLKEGSLIKEAVKRLQLGVTSNHPSAGAGRGDEADPNSSGGPIEAGNNNKENRDFYEYDCSVCDVATALNVRTVQLL